MRKRECFFAMVVAAAVFFAAGRAEAQQFTPDQVIGTCQAIMRGLQGQMMDDPTPADALDYVCGNIPDGNGQVGCEMWRAWDEQGIPVDDIIYSDQFTNYCRNPTGGDWRNPGELPTPGDPGFLPTSPGDIALTGVVVTTIVVAVVADIQLGTAIYDINQQEKIGAALSNQLAQIQGDHSDTTLECPDGTYPAPTGAPQCWNQSQEGEGCGWPAGGHDVPLGAACVAGTSCQQTLSNEGVWNGGYSCQSNGC